MSMRSLWSGAREAQKKVMTVEEAGRWTEDDAELWDLTMAEERAGNLAGPYTPEEIETQVGRLWIAARRFSIRQGEKLRPIDDFSEFGVNAAFGASEKVLMKNLDQVVAWSRAWAEGVASGSRLQLVDSAGYLWDEPLDRDWGEEGACRLVGRVADLKQAYKQLPSSPAHQALGIVAVKSPDGSRKLYKSRSLMFGQAAAVYGFLRFSRAIAALGTSLLALVLIEFFDDFTQVEPEDSAQSAQDAMEDLLELLGWELSTSDEKRKPFAQVFVSLGVQVNFSQMVDRRLLLENKPGRVEAIEAQVEAILKAPEKKLGFKDALSLRGKVAFSEGQTHCRLTAFVARRLSEWSSYMGARKIPEDLEYGLRFAVAHLKSAGPRVIRPKSEEPPIIVFTDGACEDRTSIGGVVFVPGRAPETFGCVLRERDISDWRSKNDQKQVIGQAEIFPILVAKLTWAEYFRGKRVIYFIDNESAKIALIRAYSPILASLKLVMDCSAWDFHNECSSWYARVPTICNIADSPSRMELSSVLGVLGAIVVEPIFPSGMVPAEILK